jgi:hypothetical protein
MIKIEKKGVLGDVSCVSVSSQFGDTREVAFKLLRGRDGLQIFDTVLRPMMLGLAQIVGGETFVSALQKTLQTFSQETLFDVLGTKIFAGAVIDNTTILSSKADFEKYFGENRLEFYALLAAGLWINFEKDFLQLRKMATGVFSGLTAVTGTIDETK